jgi:MFS family permease
MSADRRAVVQAADDGVAAQPAHIGTTLAALVVGQVCLHSAMAGTRMTAPLQALHDGRGPGAVGLLIGLFAAAATLLAIPVGKMADRHGSRRPALLAIGMCFAGGLVATVSQSYVALCIAGLLAGAGANTGMISMQHSAGRLADTPAQLRRVFGWLGIAPALGNFFGPLMAGVLIDHASYRAAFAVLALLPLLSLVAVRYLPRGSGHVAAEPPAPGAPRKAGTWSLLASVPMRRLLLVNWLLSASWDAHAFVLPILGFQRGLSASAIGAILGSFAVAVAVVRVLLPILGENVSERRLLSTAMLCACAVLCVYPFAVGPWTMGACAVLLGLALGSSQPVVMSTLHQITPAGRQGESIALRSMTLNRSSTAMPLAFGALGAAIGAASLFWVMGAAIGLGSLTARRVGPGGSATMVSGEVAGPR